MGTRQSNDEDRLQAVDATVMRGTELAKFYTIRAISGNADVVMLL